ncbi:MAG: triphosphoribosyl-dephospho-CoA synthase [Pirellulales bacterium]
MNQDQPSRAASWLSIEQCVSLACLLEAAAPKCGNVHRGADFADMRFEHFLAATAAATPTIGTAAQRRLGQTILQAVRQTQLVCDCNVNLGVILLLAPLAVVPPTTSLRLGVERVLHQLRPEDAADVYEAIRLANPGGLGHVEQMDVHGEPPNNLLHAMRAAEEYDMVARQWARAYDDVLNVIVPWLKSAIGDLQLSLTDAIVYVQVQTMRDFPDSLIARKGGRELALEVAARAGGVLAAGSPTSAEYRQRLADLDFYLRSDGNRRNPGTTADLIAAALFVALRDGHIPLPLKFK